MNAFSIPFASQNAVALTWLVLICSISITSGQSPNAVDDAPNRYEGTAAVADLQGAVGVPPNLGGHYESEGIAVGSVPAPQGGISNFFVLDPEVRIGVFGALSLELIASDRRLISPSSYLYLSPYFNASQETFELSGRATNIGFKVTGPAIGDFQSGGLILLYAFGQEYFANYYGITIFQGFGELQNEHWRFSFGLMQDLVNPLLPTMLNWSLGGAAGNLGFIRGQARAERFLKIDDLTQVTLQTAISQAVNTEYAVPTVNERLAFGEPDGLPNFEGRIALALGELKASAISPQPQRPFELGVSSMYGRLRTITSDFLNPPVRNVSDAAMIGIDMRSQVSDRLGFKGEFFYGQALGSYLGGVAQSVNIDTFRSIRTIGGFGEVYYYWTDSLHSHHGYGIDDPLDVDVAASQRVRNQVFFSNVILDVSKNLQLGLEVSQWQTAYSNPILGDNSAWVVHSRVQLKF